MAKINLDEMQAASHDDPIAVSAIAAAQAKAWCESWGGIPKDPFLWMQHVYVCRPAAKKLLDSLLALDMGERQAIARHLSRPKSNPIRKRHVAEPA